MTPFQGGVVMLRGARAGFALFLLGAGMAAEQDAHAQVADHERVGEALAVVETWLEAQMAFEQVPSMSAAVVHDQELVWSGAMGMAHPARGLAATEETLYSICSISKLFTAIGVMQLRDGGLLDLRDPVADHLPWYAVSQRHETSAPVTLQGILTHSAGLPRESDHPYWTGPDFPFPTREEVVAGVPNQETLYPAWRTFQYSNLGLTLAGEIISERSGVPYERYVRHNILDPLGMGNTYPDIPEAHRGGRLATGYGGITRDGTREEVAFWQARGIAPAAGFASTPRDLARFAQWQFRLMDDGRTEEVLRGHTLQEMHRVHYVDPGWNTFWGIGFSISRGGDRTFIGHGGSCPGYRSQFMMDPKDRIAVIFMANAMVNAGGYARGIHGLVAEAIRNAAGEDKETADPEEAPDRSGLELSDYVGTYDAQPWGAETAVVRWRGSLALLGLPTDNPAQALRRLAHDEGDVFYRVRSDGDRGEDVIFERDDRGEVTGYRVHGQLSRRLR
jgi:CubicO group peptidase (beta-lactamase class C family)